MLNLFQNDIIIQTYWTAAKNKFAISQIATKAVVFSNAAVQNPKPTSSQLSPKKLYTLPMNIQEQFNAVAKEYDENRRKFIPCFEDYYVSATDIAEKCLPLQKSGLKMFPT